MELIQYQEMREAIQRVRELHKPIEIANSDYEWCKHCYDSDDGYTQYPCQTIKALDGK